MFLTPLSDMKNLLYGLLLTVLIAGCNQNTQSSEQTTQEATKTDTTVNKVPIATVPQAQLIIPGKAVGLTSLDEDAKDVINRLGPPDSGDAAMGKAMSTWYSDHDPKRNQTTIYTERQMGVDETSRVKQIRITSSWFSTADDIHVGSALHDINRYFNTRKEAAYSEGGANYLIYTTDKGITFEVNADSTCSGIIVHDSSKNVLSVYLPFHPDIKKMK